MVCDLGQVAIEAKRRPADAGGSVSLLHLCELAPEAPGRGAMGQSLERGGFPVDRVHRRSAACTASTGKRPPDGILRAHDLPV